MFCSFLCLIIRAFVFYACCLSFTATGFLVNKDEYTKYHLSRQTAIPSIDAPIRRPNTTPILTTITTPTQIIIKTVLLLVIRFTVLNYFSTPSVHGYRNVFVTANCRNILLRLNDYYT